MNFVCVICREPFVADRRNAICCNRVCAGKHRTVQYTKRQREWFWEKVDARGPDECWEWTGNRNALGYGRLGGGTLGAHLAHRKALELSGVAVPSGKLVLHSCDNPPCCNPAHLRVGTYQDNSDDKVKRGRQQRGSKAIGAKLTEDDVREIIRRYAKGESQQALGAEYSIGGPTISQIIRGRNWRHVTAEIDMTTLRTTAQQARDTASARATSDAVGVALGMEVEHARGRV